MATIQQFLTSDKGLDGLHMSEAPMPSPGKGEVLVEVHSVSLNYRDTEAAMGLYTHHKSINQQPAVVPCSDMCGVITKVGDGVSGWKVGDRVLSTFLPEHQSGQVTEKELSRSMGLPLNGVLTTHRVFPEYSLVAAPDYLTDDEASTLTVAGVTSWMSINGMRPMGQNGGKGEYILFQGTGGVSIAGLQLAKASGATVIITSSSDDKLEQAKKLGADYTINYSKTPDWEKEVMRITNNHGADIILEVGGARTLNKSLSCVAFGGLINCIGYLSGKVNEPDDRTNLNLLILSRNVTLKGIINGPKDRFEEMNKFYEKHEIHPVISNTFPFKESQEAFKCLYSGSHFGKVVIQVKKA